MRLLPLAVCALSHAGLALSACHARAQAPAGGEQNAARIVAARVNDAPIYADEVDRIVAQAVGERAADAAAQRALRAAALEQLVNRRLVLEHLAKTRQGASQQDVDLALVRIEKQLAQQEQTLDAYLEKAGLTADEFRRTLAWQIGWDRYLDAQLTEENLQKYFQRHKRDFDGTSLRVAHILLKVDPPSDSGAIDAAVRRAEQIYEDVSSGKITFAAAAQEYSQAPTADKGGDIGWIERREPMPESFSQAAFALQAGEVSRPVASPFGVHLIQCLEVKAGEKTWQEAIPQLEPAVTRYLFQWLADQERKTARIEIMTPMEYSSAPPATTESPDSQPGNP